MMRAAPRSRARHDVHRPIGPTPITTTTSPGRMPTRILPAQHAGERLDQRGDGRVDASAIGMTLPWRDGRGRDAHVLGKAAVQGDADAPDSRRSGCCCPKCTGGSARSPCWAPQRRAGRPPNPRRPRPPAAISPPPRGRGCARCRAGTCGARRADAQIRAADARAVHAEQRLARPDRGNRTLLQTQIIGTVVDRGQHGDVACRASLASPELRRQHPPRGSLSDTPDVPPGTTASPARTPATAQRPSSPATCRRAPRRGCSPGNAPSRRYSPRRSACGQVRIDRPDQAVIAVGAGDDGLPVQLADLHDPLSPTISTRAS